MSGDAADRYNQLYGGDGGMSMVVLLQSRNATEKVTTNQNAMQFVSDLKVREGDGAKAGGAKRQQKHCTAFQHN